MARKFDTFGDLSKGALGPGLIASDDILDLFDGDVVFEFPFAPEGFPTRLDGRDQLAAHLAKLGPLLSFEAFHLDAAHQCDEVVVLEFRCEGHAVETGLPYDQSYISVVTLQNRRIVRYKDYWNPLVALAALSGTDAKTALASERAQDA